MKFVLKINKHQIWTLCVLFFVFEPQYFSTIKIIDYIFVVAKIVIGAYYFIVVFRNKKRIDMPIIIFFVTCIYLFGISVISRHPSMSKSMDFFESLIMLLVVTIEMDRDIKDFLRCMSKYSLFLMLVNLLCIILFPKGLYITVTNSVWEKEHICWLLGYKNPLSRFAIGTISLLLINDAVCNIKLSKSTMIGIVGAVASILMVDSATSLVSLAFQLVLVFLFARVNWLKFINLFTLFVGFGALSFIMIQFRIQERYEYFLAKVLNRSTSFSGRTRIWDNSIATIRKSFVYGYGLTTGDSTTLQIGATHPHNWYLYILYSGGIIAMLLMVMFFGYITHEIYKNLSRREIRICHIAIAAFFLMAMTESLTQTLPMFFSLIGILYVLGTHGSKVSENFEKNA